MPQTNRYTNWRKAKESNDANGCVELSFAVDGMVAIRDSKLGDGSPILEFTDREYRFFVNAIKGGEFELPG